MPPPSAPRSWGSRWPSSTRTSSAARASTAAASRPRPCSSRPPSPSASATPPTSGSTCRARPTIDYAQMAKRRDQVVTRMWKGVQTLVKKYDVTWIQGRGKLDGAHKVRVQMAGDDGTPGAKGERVLNATDIILATGSRVKSLPGHRARRQADRDLGRRPQDGHPARERHRDRGGRGRRRVRVDVPRPRLDGDRARVPAGDRAARGPRRQQGAGAELQPARDQGHDQRPLRRQVGQGRGRLRQAHRRAGGQGRDRDRGRDPARRRGPRDERRGRRPGHDERRGRPRHRQGRRPHAHEGAAPVRDRRHRRWPDARPHGGARGDHRGPHDRRRPRRPPDGLRAAAAGHVLPARDRVGRPHRAAVRGARPADQGRQGPVPGDRQGDHRRRVRGLRQGHRQQGDRGHARHPHHRPARDRPHRRGVAGPLPRRDAVGDRRLDPRAPDVQRRSSARPRWRSTDGRSTSSLAAAAAADARSRTGPRRTR